jgi:hypothetical protein
VGVSEGPGARSRLAISFRKCWDYELRLLLDVPVREGIGDVVEDEELLEGLELVDIAEEVGLVLERDDEEEMVLVVLDLELVVMLDVGPEVMPLET